MCNQQCRQGHSGAAMGGMAHSNTWDGGRARSARSVVCKLAHHEQHLECTHDGDPGPLERRVSAALRLQGTQQTLPSSAEVAQMHMHSLSRVS